MPANGFRLILPKYNTWNQTTDEIVHISYDKPRRHPIKIVCFDHWEPMGGKLIEAQKTSVGWVFCWCRQILLICSWVGFFCLFVFLFVFCRFVSFSPYTLLWQVCVPWLRTFLCISVSTFIRKWIHHKRRQLFQNSFGSLLKKGFYSKRKEFPSRNGEQMYSF